MIKRFLRKLGFVKINYGFSCGRHWLEIDGKMIYQANGADYYMKNESVKKLTIAIMRECIWNKCR